MPSDGSSKSTSANKKPTAKILNGSVGTTKTIEVKVLSSGNKTADQTPISNLGASYQELAKCYKSEVEDDEMAMNNSFEDEYESSPETYLENNGESFTLKVIDNESNISKFCV